MSTTIPVKDALELASENYKEYSIYVAAGRAYGSVIDGAKSVQKRVIYSLYKKAPRSIIKVAEAAGYCLDMHPHPTAVPEVIVSLGDTSNKFNFLDKQGNFGNRIKNIEASAPRYIGCRLSDLAIELTCDGVEYCPTMTGELDKPEPIALPTLLPLCFLNSMSGIPAGLPKLNIPSLDIEGMFDYYLDILKHKDLNYVPKKLPIPNVGVPILSSKNDWEDVLKTGKGTVRLAPEMSIDKDGVITITAMPASKTASEKHMVLAIGQMIHRKGFDVLLHATKDLDPDTGIYFVGGEAKEEYITLTKELGLQSVHFLGFQKKDVLAKYYKASDVFVLPTREDIWGLVINEAMAYGLPTITTDRCVAGLELIEDGINGYVVPVEDAAALAEKIKAVLASDLEAMGKAALEKVRPYTLENMAKTHAEIFESGR